MPPGEDGLYTLLMDNNALVQLIVDALDDVKGQDIRVYDTTDKTSAFERVIVVSGTSNRQTRALAISAARAVKTAASDPAPGSPDSAAEDEQPAENDRSPFAGLRIPEGYRLEQIEGEWVLVDCGSVTVHRMQPAVRDYYNLAELWGPTPMKRPAEPA